MKKFSKITLLLVVILMFASLSFAEEAVKADPAAAAAAVPKKLKVGDVVTEFKLPDGISKADVTFNNDIKGKSKVIAISFMTTACSACKGEMNLLSDLANKYGDDFKAYAISVDLNGEKTIPAYDSTFGFNLRYMLDPDFKIAQMFGFTYTPGLVLADGSGKILYLQGGYTSSEADEIIKLVKDILK